jgi:TolB protein
MSDRKWIGMITLGMLSAGCARDVSRPVDLGPGDALSGALEVSITVTGTSPPREGYTLVVSIEEEGDLPAQTLEPGGGTVDFPDVPPGDHSVRLDSLAANCSTEGSTTRPFSVMPEDTTGIEFKIFCPGPENVAGVFERVSPFSEEMLEYHGSLSSRYVIEDDGTFSLQYQSANYDYFEYLGTWSIVDAGLIFVFDGISARYGPSGREVSGEAIATLSADCLTVEYNIVMVLSDFQDGEYCQSLGAITGTVATGVLPFGGAAVTGSGGTVTRTDTTGPEGAFTFPDLPAREYTLSAQATGTSCVSRNVTVAAGKTATVEIPCVLSYDLSDGAGIYIGHLDGSGATRLTTGRRPAWSPDGLRIAFDRNAQVYVINADSSNETALNPGVDPAWSPDGTKIVFADPECISPSCSARHPGISVMDADGSNVSRLIGGDFIGSDYSIGVGMPAWSPDGKTIAFNHLGDGEMYPAQIYLMNADGSQLRRLTTSGGRQYAESDPSWSPNGSRIALWSHGYGVATVSANGGIPSTVYLNFPFVHYGAQPVWSPDGKAIVFTADRNGLSTGPDLQVVSSDGGFAWLLIDGGYDAAWSPDGARIAFVFGTPDA